MKIIFIPISLVVVFAGCKDRYQHELKNSATRVLVVEGVLNAGQGITEFRLTRSLPLDDQLITDPELNAQVTVEGINGDVYNLNETGNGSYVHNQLPITVNGEYRLRIRTQDNREYISDFVEVKTTPGIDSITWIKDHDGLKLHVSTHDPLNNTRYYKWDFDETWEINSYYAAQFEWTGGVTIVSSPDYRYRCWRYDSSTTINIASTAHLEQDVVSRFPVHFIPLGSDKVSVRYSVLVRQQSLTKAAYEYFLLMKKNTENLGTIFDPQPSQLTGNIRCISDPSENVIGFVTASSFSEKRFFLTSVQADWQFTQDCPSMDVLNHPDSIKKYVPIYLPWDAQYSAGGAIEYWYMAKAACVDCTLRGGNLNKPSFW